MLLLSTLLTMVEKKFISSIIKIIVTTDSIVTTNLKLKSLPLSGDFILKISCW
jgi:hypothetical protein